MLHVGTLPYRDAYTGVAGFRRLMDRFPRLRVCVAHMGCFEHEAFLALTERFEHLYVDTTMALAPSAVPFVGAEPGGITDATLLAHQDRILFGSDFPLIPYDYDEERRWAWGRVAGPRRRLALVGGVVRDCRLGRPAPADLDVAVEAGALDLARRVAARAGAAFVPLDPERGTA